MKKLLTLFAVLAFTAPVFAADGDPNVLITIVDEGGGVVQVNYEVLVEDGVDPGLMRGIALKISTSNTALIDAISDYATGSVPADSTQIPSGYSVFMGSIQFASDPNYVSSFGDPVAPSGDPGAGDDLPDAAEIVVELGSLYAEGGTAPGTSGTLFKLTLDDNGESDTVLIIEGESTRGGDQGECVMEDGSQANIKLSDATDAYLVTFEPACWSCDGQDEGNYLPDAAINFGDLIALKKAFGTKADTDPHGTDQGEYNCCCDVDHDGDVDFAELIKLKQNFGKSGYTPCTNTSCP